MVFKYIAPDVRAFIAFLDRRHFALAKLTLAQGSPCNNQERQSAEQRLLCRGRSGRRLGWRQHLRRSEVSLEWLSGPIRPAGPGNQTPTPGHLPLRLVPSKVCHTHTRHRLRVPTHLLCRAPKATNSLGDRPYVHESL